MRTQILGRRYLGRGHEGMLKFHRGSMTARASPLSLSDTRFPHDRRRNSHLRKMTVGLCFSHNLQVAPGGASTSPIRPLGVTNSVKRRYTGVRLVSRHMGPIWRTGSQGPQRTGSALGGCLVGRERITYVVVYEWFTEKLRALPLWSGYI